MNLPIKFLKKIKNLVLKYFLRHKEDYHTIIWPNGDKVWWSFNGLVHRIDGPAIEKADGTKEWWFHGLRHRRDGPAIEYANGAKSWYIDGMRINNISDIEYLYLRFFPAEI